MSSIKRSITAIVLATSVWIGVGLGRGGAALGTPVVVAVQTEKTTVGTLLRWGDDSLTLQTRGDEEIYQFSFDVGRLFKKGDPVVGDTVKITFHLDGTTCVVDRIERK